MGHGGGMRNIGSCTANKCKRLILTPKKLNCTCACAFRVDLKDGEWAVFKDTNFFCVPPMNEILAAKDLSPS